MIDIADLIMESYVEIIVRLAKQRKIKKGELAEKVWKDYSPTLAARKWLYIRSPSPTTGRPQELSLADAYKLAAALDQDPAYLLLEARHMANEKFRVQEEREAAATSKKKKGDGKGGSKAAQGGELPKVEEPIKKTRRKRRTIK